MPSTILTHPNDLLRQPALPVDPACFGTDALRGRLAEMKVLMHEDRGVGLAATQLGYSERIIIVDLPKEGPTAFLNPELILTSPEKIEFEEGCLSVPGVFGIVLRHRRVTVRAWTADGIIREINAKDLTAVVFQHEIDHLDGVLFIDKMIRKTHGGSVRV